MVLFNEKYKRDYSPAFNLKNEFIKFIKESNINFTQQRLLFSFPKPANYSNVKYRDKYLLSSGDDGIVRIWTFDKNKEDFFFFGEYGEKITAEANFDIMDYHLYYAIDKTLHIFNIYSGKNIVKKDFSGKIEDINLENNRIYIYFNGIKSGYYFSDNKFIVDTVGKYETLNPKRKKVKIETNSSIQIVKSAVVLNDSKTISLNPILPIYGVQKFDDYLIIYYKNGNEICFNKDGEIKFKTSTENKDLNIKYLNLQQPKINFYAFENDFIIEKNGFYYGSKNWKNYLYFIENDKICLNNEGYDYYFDSITKKELFKEI